MKKLLTLAILTISLTSCETSEMNYNELVNQTQQKEININSKTFSEDHLIKNAIELVKLQAMIKLNRNTLEPTDPTNPQPFPENEEDGTILCSSPLNSPFGSACVWNSSGSLVRVTWEPRRDLYWIGGHNGGWNYPPDLTAESKTYTGIVVSQCNC